jgi:predicted dehydrogenase
MSTRTIAIIGLGQGLSHLQAFQMLPDSTVVAVCDSDYALAQRIAQQYHIPHVYDHIEAVLANRAVDAVVIATPDHLHGQHTIMALNAGKHVLCEIPMALTIAECQHIIALSERHGLTYQMGNQVRYAECLHDIAGLLRAGDLGPLFYGEGEYLHDMHDIVDNRPADHWRINPATPQTTLLGGGPHALDTLRWLMGVRFGEVQAYHVSQPSDWQTTHTTVALFKADSGAVCKITVSYGMQRPYCLYYSVYGNDGSFERSRDQAGPMQETTNYYYHRKLSGARRMIPATVPNWYNPRLPRNLTLGHGTMEVAQAQQFLAAIHANRLADIHAREAADSIIPLICALQSADNGGGVVQIPAS